MILAIDTSAGTSVALIEDGQVRAEVTLDDNMRHAEVIGQAIEKVLADAFVQPQQINVVVAGRGPAPFTGLRVGIAAATMFAAGAHAKLFGAVSLDAIARDEISRGETHPLLVTTDARRKEVYWALYEGADKDGVPIRIDGPHVSKPADLEELLRERGIEPIHAQAKMSASSLGLLAHDLQKAGRLESDTSALYLRAPDAVEPNPNKPFGKPVSG
jgi:tRNA threonylcarbamoyl adenosine modification protein YeaZ